MDVSIIKTVLSLKTDFDFLGLIRVIEQIIALADQCHWRFKKMAI